MKLKIFLGILTVILLVLSVMSADIKHTAVDVDDSNFTNSTDIGHISEGTSLEYSFKASGETIEGFGFLFATFGEEITKGIIYMEIYDDTGKMIADGRIHANTVEDNEINIIKTKRISLGKRNIRVMLHCEGFEADKQLTLWLGKNSENEEGKTFVNGIPLDNNLLIFANKVSKEAPYTWDMILLTSICFVAFCSAPKSNKEKLLGGNGDVEEKIAEA